jgi:hypothetical protein
MKTAFFTVIALALFLSSATAHPRHYRHHANPVAQSLGAGLIFMLQHKNDDPRHRWHEDWSVNPAGTGLPAPCRQAARMGGPCGCWAAYTLFGRLEHVVNGINLWLASDWLRFPRASSVSDANAAVYLGRGGRAYHVAPIVAGVAHDYFGDHAVAGRVVYVYAQL